MPPEKRTPVRTINLDSLEALAEELDRLESASAAGTLRRTGSWSLGQCCQHIGKFFNGALDGFDGKAPLPLRVLAKMFIKRKALGPEPMPGGINLPAAASALLPDPDISDEAGLAFLREPIARVGRGERFKHPSPLFGKLTHEQWMTLQLKHAALHLGFLDPGEGA